MKFGTLLPVTSVHNRMNCLSTLTYLKQVFLTSAKTLTFSGALPQSSDRKNKEIQRKLEMCCLFSSFF